MRMAARVRPYLVYGGLGQPTGDLGRDEVRAGLGQGGAAASSSTGRRPARPQRRQGGWDIITGSMVAVAAAIALIAGGTLIRFTLFAFGQSRLPAEIAGAFLTSDPLAGALAGVVVSAARPGPRNGARRGHPRRHRAEPCAAARPSHGPAGRDGRGGS
jgi:hypothetical protein